MKTLLELINEISTTLGLGGKLNSAIGSNDANIIQLVSVFQDAGECLVDEEPYVIDLSDDRWVIHQDGSVSPNITADTDRFFIDDILLKKHTLYLWKYNKGLEYGEDLRDATKRINFLASERQMERVHY